MKARALLAALVLLAGCDRPGDEAPKLAGLNAPAAAAVPQPPRWPATDVATLQRRLRGALAASALATSGIVVVDAGGRPLFERRPNVPLVPASTFKVLVATTALATFGPEYRFETTFESLDGPHDGTLAGDLYVVGSGDPTLRSADLRAGAAALAASGLRRIAGRIVADASAFAGPEVNPAWVREDLQYGFAAGVSALAIDEGTAEFHLIPSRIGAAARIEVLPPNDEVRVNGTIRTGYASDFGIDRDPNGNDFTVSGRIASGAEQSYWRPVAALPRYAAAVVRASLGQQAIAVGGPAATGTAPLGAQVLWRHRSPPLREILAQMLFESDNHHAEQLLRAVGTQAASVGTEITGGQAERALFRRFDIPEEGLRIVDGSGLAPTDRVAPLALATFLARAVAEPYGPALIRALPRVGIEGTVRRRGVTTALGRVRAKSGHIENVNALTGFVQTHAHGRVAFAIIVNDPRADDGLVDDGIDRALDILASF